MTRLIPKNHFALSRQQYYNGLATGKFKTDFPSNLSIKKVAATFEALECFQMQMDSKWHWKSQARYMDKDGVRAKLAEPETALYVLQDNGLPIGYVYVTAPDAPLRERFWGSANHSVIEFENIGMFPGNEGKGRGRNFINMLMANYFKDYDTIYWSQHEATSPTLKQFYRDKVGMTLLATDMVPDFRPRQKKFG